MAITVALALPCTLAGQETPAALLTRAVARSGGDALLRAVNTTRYEYVTSWYRTSFEQTPAAAALSIEQNVDVRDYGRGIWRYERRFTGFPVITDIVRDTVAITDFGRGWEPLSGAYVDERDELFLAAPERLLVHALEAARDGLLRTGADTVIAGRPHARVAGTLRGYPVMLFIRKGDAQLTGLRFIAAQPWDFGLAAWGEMLVEVWYSRWTMADGLLVPFDIAVDRVGRPYKRIGITRAQYNVAIAEDSVSVSDSLRTRYVKEQRRAMFDLPVDSVRISQEGFATFGVPGTPLGAAKKPGGWLLYGAGAAPLITDRAVTRLRATGTPITAAIVGTMAVGSAGGAPTIARHGVTVFAAATARSFLTAMFAQQKTPLAAVRWVTEARWYSVAGDSLWLEPVDMPDQDGGLVAWDPRTKWLYAGDNPGPAQIRAALVVAERRAWPVERMFVRGRPTTITEARRLAGLTT